MPKLSKADTRTLNMARQHAANGNLDAARRILGGFVRSAPSEKIQAKRREAAAEMLFDYLPRVNVSG